MWRLRWIAIASFIDLFLTSTRIDGLEHGLIGTRDMRELRLRKASSPYTTIFPNATIHGEGLPGLAIEPSSRCANREEWQGECRTWSGEPHNRYLEFARLLPKEGLGANLLRVHWVLNRAVSFDLEPVIIGPLLAGHGTGDFGDWMGLTNNPILAVRDIDGFNKAERQPVPFPEGDGEDWFLERRNETSVVYVVNPMSVKKIKDWGVPVATTPSDPRVCKYARQALRNIYWSVPRNRNRCGEMLAGEAEFIDHGLTQNTRRPWVIAFHIRRGDMIKFRGGVRSVPHAYFAATARAVLRGIASVDPEASVFFLIFSEGKKGKSLKGNQIMDEKGRVVNWDILPDCESLGLRCTQKTFLETSLFNTFDCLAAADVVVGSESSLSEAAAAVSTNVKIMLWEGQEEQDRVTFNSNEIATVGEVNSQDQLELNNVISDWFFCQKEATRGSNGNDSTVSAYARQFYQTV